MRAALGNWFLRKIGTNTSKVNAVAVLRMGGAPCTARRMESLRCRRRQRPAGGSSIRSKILRSFALIAYGERRRRVEARRGADTSP